MATAEPAPHQPADESQPESQPVSLAGLVGGAVPPSLSEQTLHNSAITSPSGKSEPEQQPEPEPKPVADPSSTPTLEEGVPPEPESSCQEPILVLELAGEGGGLDSRPTPTTLTKGPPPPKANSVLNSVLLALLLEATSEEAAPPSKEALHGIAMACGDRCLDEIRDVVIWMRERLTHESLFGQTEPPTCGIRHLSTVRSLTGMGVYVHTVKHKTLVTLQYMFSQLPLLVDALKSAPAVLMEIEALKSFQAPDDPKFGDKPVLIIRDAASAVIGLLEEQLNVTE